MSRETSPTCCIMEPTEEGGPECSLVEQQTCSSAEQQDSDADHRQAKKIQKSKGKLIRSVAVCDESLPSEFNSKESEVETIATAENAGSLELDEDEQRRHKEGSTRKKPSLSKESSLEYTNSTGIDLEEFLITTLKSSPRDRLMLLKLEQDMTDFMTDNCSYKKFPQMSSYHRMLVHRVAAYFGLEHNVDHSGKAVIINKTSNSRIPEQRFAEHVQEEKTEERRSILKRDSSQEKEDIQRRVPLLKEQAKSKSLEEREEEYQRARERIFSQDSSCAPKSVYIETRVSEDCYNLHSETQRKRQLFSKTKDGSGRLSGSMQSSFEQECYWSDCRPWSSTDSDSSTWTSKPLHSCSDSSSKLYKPVSEAGATSGPLSAAPASNSPAYIIVPPESSILPGSILINPHTGQPYLNPDGTPAVYNPPANQQPMSNQLNTMQPQAPPPPHQQQQPMTTHGVPQYSTVTYLPPQQMLNPSQPHPPEQCREDLSSQFSHMTLNHQSSAESLDPPACYLQGAHSYAQPQHSYAAPLPVDSYLNSGMALAPPTAPPLQTCSQQNTQASVYSYPAQCPNSLQQYGPASYSTQTGYPPLLPNQQQAYSSMVGTQVLPQTQQSIMGTYPSSSSYQMAPQLQPYSTMLVPRQGGQSQSAAPPAGVSVYCNTLPPSPPPPVSSLAVTCQSSNCRNACNRNQNQCWY
ncbi:cAMP-regulated phosphoprotein 21 isoform X1 [Astyanax mexicanus]|uniref:cAMP-regulated phosphoprotein 21 isoform X1 n=1 Tax=Astyanax mexicanus TaxID=7994 RepID=A0A8T2M9D2_ASTMX|nr:cAMP-regulated phosphoprotein 21 isoform X1 [Astyanax mexicanus]